MLGSAALRECGLLDRCMQSSTLKPTCGKILLHSKMQVMSFRKRMGLSLCIFKIGVTTNPPIRFITYKQKNFSHMWILHKSDHVELIHMLVAALISEHQLICGCRNAADSGGEGALNRTHTDGPPFFVYVTGGRADQGRWVG